MILFIMTLLLSILVNAQAPVGGEIIQSGGPHLLDDTNPKSSQIQVKDCEHMARTPSRDKTKAGQPASCEDRLGSQKGQPSGSVAPSNSHEGKADPTTGP